MTGTVPDPRRDTEHERTFREAQRAADTIFSHYQLSQLLATHARSTSMAEAVLDELIHVCDAAGGGIWLTHQSDAAMRVVARAGDRALPAAAELRAFASASPTSGEPWIVVELEDVGFLALAARDADGIDPGARRFLTLVRHELAAALRSAQLRETLELERTELSAIFENASDAIVVVDADLRATRVNPAAQRLFGRNRDDILGERCSALFACMPHDESTRACRRCPLARVMRSGDAVDGDERLVVAPTGETTTVVGSYAATSRTPDGRAQAVAILRDTSELARLAELRRGFLASVSHELRTPLGLIKGYVETLLHLQPDPASARGYLERIDETTDRLGHLVEQILDATQLAAGQLVLDLVEVDLAGLVHDAVDQLMVHGHPGDLALDLAASVPTIRADRERLRQVLDNLLANAQKYGAEAPISVRLQRSGDMLELRVSDSGIGIPADERELIFEQFHRARNVRERRLSGSGLGLAISRRIVEAHGGTLGFDPDRTDGATAIMRLPIPSTAAAGGSVAIPIAAGDA